jgi:cytochrome P450
MSATVESLAVPPDVPFLDIVDPAFDFDAPEVAAAQAKSWYAQSPIGLLVLRYNEAQELLRDQRLDHNSRGYMEMNGIVDGPIYDWYVPMILNQEGEEHRRLRGLVSQAFNARMINNLQPFIRAQAESLAESLASAETCDFIEEFGNLLPLAVVCELFGVPVEDYHHIRRWTTDIGLVFSLAHGGDIPARVEAAVVGLCGYADSLIEAKKATPADDLISALVAVQQAEGQVSSEELRNLIVSLVFAAHDTTRYQIANAMVAFSAHQEQWTLLAQRPELMTQAVEEVIRWCPSAGTFFRCAAEDLDYRGLHIAKGVFILICVRPAQRDPSVFANGDLFDITAARNVAPLLFGGGPHYCLGAALARAELREAMAALSSRLGPPSVAGPVSWRPPTGIYGPNELRLRFG